LFICDVCLCKLEESHAFKDKCIENYESEYQKCEVAYEEEEILMEPEELVAYNRQCIGEDDMHNHEYVVKAEPMEEVPFEEIEGNEHFLEDESGGDELDHIEEEEDKKVVRYRARYSAAKKLDAIAIAEQSSNRQASKILTIDESCIRKWRLKKEAIQLVHEKKPMALSFKLERNNENFKLERTNESLKLEQSNEPQASTSTEEYIIESIDDTAVETKTEQRPKEFRPRKSYSSGQKLEVVSFAEVTGNRQAAKIYQIDESCIRKWRGQKELLECINQERGTKRKPNLHWPELEAELRNWVNAQMDTGKLLKPSEIKAQAIQLAKERNIDNFKGTSSYIFKFMERYHIPARKPKNSKKNAMQSASSKQPHVVHQVHEQYQ